MTTTDDFELECKKLPFMTSAFPLMAKCEQKAERHQMPYFTLLACDNFAMECIYLWLRQAREARIPEEKYTEARLLAEKMHQWRIAHPEQCKVPD